jgi:acyl-CoA oxidase
MLFNLLHPSPEINAESKRVLEEMENDPILRNTHKFYEMTVEEQRISWFKKTNHLYFNKDRKFYFEQRMKPEFAWPTHYQGTNPTGLHMSMFRDSVENLGDEQQVAEWLPKIVKNNIFGCYAQTEIGHGSDVSGIETTATFDKKADEFVVNTPT